MRSAIGAPFGFPAAKHKRYSGEFDELRKTFGWSATADAWLPWAATGAVAAALMAVLALLLKAPWPSRQALPAIALAGLLTVPPAIALATLALWVGLRV